MKFVVSYSKEKDIENYLNSVWQFKYLKHGRKNLREKLLAKHPQEFSDNLKNAQSEVEARKIISEFLDNLPETFCQKIEDFRNQAEKLLNDAPIIEKLEQIYQKTFPFDEITVYITTLSICPYNFKEKWFMITRSKEDVLTTATHELNHFMFYFYYSESLKDKLEKQKIEEIKEAITILTNPEGNDKPSIKYLEEYILSIKEKSIDEIIDLAAKMVSTHGER